MRKSAKAGEELKQQQKVVAQFIHSAYTRRVSFITYIERVSKLRKAWSTRRERRE